MSQGVFINKNIIIGFIISVFVFMFIVSVTYSICDFNLHKKSYDEEARDMVNERMKSLLFQINVFPKYIGNELLFLSQLSSMKAVLNYSNKVDVLQSDFLRFMEGSKSYHRLRYIDENGSQIVEINYNGANYNSIPKEKLQYKEDKYFNKTMELFEGEVYLSELGLNTEYGKLENRGTDEYPIYIPTLKIATPVFRTNGARAGIIILNIYADYFLNDIRSAQKEGEKMFLINKEGFYLSNPDRKKEFTFMLNGSANFFKDYPEISKSIISGYDRARIETDYKVFFFRYVHPTLGDIGLINASKEAAEDSLEYYWILVAVSDKDSLDKTIYQLKDNYFRFLWCFGIIIVIISLILFKVYLYSYGGRQ